MSTTYPHELADLISAAAAAADAHKHDLGKRKRGEEDAYLPATGDLTFEPDSTSKQSTPAVPTLSHSAAVLFREPSEKSKKYSRPPLGKVFTSLELAPETFLQLQNAAKEYMLSPQHPERRDVVGHKKNHDNNDQAKLRLYQCVEDFLYEDDNGEKYFGRTAALGNPSAPLRSFYWPDDRGRIIKVLMPLLRKMVTNERQRLYAAETRKQDGGKDKASRKHKQVTPARDLGSEAVASDLVNSEIDPTLQAEIGPTPQNNDQIEPVGTQDVSLHQSDASAVTLRVSIVKKDGGSRKRLMPDFTLASEAAGTIEEFIDGLKQNLDILSGGLEVKALLPQSGLTTMNSENDWLLAQFAIASEEWMNGQLQVIVEV